VHTPSISIITACYNCGQYIDETIRSVLSQNKTVHAKYIIIDGRSTDNTLDILKTYENQLDILISEPDHGMYHAITKGSQCVDTEVMAWLNADDLYFPWTLSVVAEIFKKFPDVDWIIGQPSYLNERGQCIKVSSNAGTAYPNKYIRNGWFKPSIAGYLQQESMFWRKSLWDKAGGLDLKYRYAADFELWTRFARYAELYSVCVPLASFRKRPGQTSVLKVDKYFDEVNEICHRLKPANKNWAYLGKKSNILRIIPRLMIWKKCNLIAYSEPQDQWVLKSILRPLSRYSVTELLLEWYIRK